MDVASTSALELDPITYVSHPHWVVTPVDDFFSELDGHKLPLVRPLDVLELDLKSPLDSPS